MSKLGNTVVRACVVRPCVAVTLGLDITVSALPADITVASVPFTGFCREFSGMARSGALP